MNRQFYTINSRFLNKPMNILVYGEGWGFPLLIFPTQNSKCSNMEDFGMIDTMADWLENGTFQAFCVDANDEESWSAEGADPAWRAQRQEEYYNFIIEEVLPFMRDWNHTGKLPAVTGFSMGGTHAAIVFLRRPDLFSGMLGVSGVYDSNFFFGNWMNGTLYQNCPTAFMRNMPPDHPYIRLYNEKRIVFCIGQGAWESGLDSMRDLEHSMQRLGIHAWFDYWGYDVNHDWPWWKKMVRYHLPQFLY